MIHNEDELVHPLMQLRKVVSLNGDKPVKFRDGSSHSFAPEFASEVLDFYAGLRPTEKEALQDFIAESAMNMISYPLYNYVEDKEPVAEKEDVKLPRTILKQSARDSKKTYKQSALTKRIIDIIRDS